MVASGMVTPVGGATGPAPLSAPPTAFHSGPATTAVTPYRQPTPRKLEGTSGMTPSGKRPMAREQIQIALTGERPMTHDELTSGFFALLRRVETEEAFTNEMSKAVIHNCELLDMHAARSSETRAAVELLPTKHDQMVVGLQNNISEAVLNFDSQLRKEIDVVMFEVEKKLQEQFATMSQIVSSLQQPLPQAPGPQPQADAIGRIASDIADLKLKITSVPDYTKMIQEQRDGNSAALASLRSEASTAHAELRAEASAAHAGLRAEMSAAVAALRSAPPVVSQSGQQSTQQGLSGFLRCHSI